MADSTVPKSVVSTNSTSSPQISPNSANHFRRPVLVIEAVRLLFVAGGRTNGRCQRPDIGSISPRACAARVSRDNDKRIINLLRLNRDYAIASRH